ncbi:uncharacterized protein K444DRAFT_74435 [Hyaloscypha bicolor E]|uniref:Uncharacterized protein n=1 Tax=Hyaloscypha bicolor E TaxID=1095630 RepID=A0A2J6SXW0_9HELO|nr:uncharacterized protein K444DRAFT_74435 [Hyaloscypha bicolor E]PMD55615.1 hypothetical protein K444DRAFT_74435 [Hyaloscypha bicolor E]
MCQTPHRRSARLWLWDIPHHLHLHEQTRCSSDDVVRTYITSPRTLSQHDRRRDLPSANLVPPAETSPPCLPFLPPS